LTSLKLNYCRNIILAKKSFQIKRHQNNLLPSGVVSRSSLRVRRTALVCTQPHRGPTGGGQLQEIQEKKRQRWKHALHWQQFTRASSRRSIPGKTLDTNQSNQSYIRSSTRIPRITYACTSGISGYIKRV